MHISCNMIQIEEMLRATTSVPGSLKCFDRGKTQNLWMGVRSGDSHMRNLSLM